MNLNAIIRDMLQQTIINALNTECLVEKGQKILLGFSGGPDSVYLLDVLVQAGYDVEIAYFDHQLRPESAGEVAFAHQIAAQYKIGLVTGTANISNLAREEKEGVESTARKYRYRFLAKEAVEMGAAAIAVAHHADDQVETILMNIIRGTGLNGLAGMSYRTAYAFTEDVPVIRPMLDVWKRDILAYCEEKNLKYMTDLTNFESDYTRNQLRNEIIPALRAINPNVKENILRMRAILQDENALISDLATSSTKNAVSRDETDLVEINLPQFNQLSVSLQRRVIMNALSASFSIDKDLRFQLIEDIRSLFIGEIRSSRIQPDDNLRVLVEGDSGFIFRDISKLSSVNEVSLSDSAEALSLEIPGMIRINPYWNIQAEMIGRQAMSSGLIPSERPLIVYLDADKVKGRLYVRRKQAGDRYAPLGMDGHSMKVSDFWINKKTPLRLRENWPLVCDQEKILWIPGYQPAHAVRITDSTESVVQLMIVRADY